MSLAAVSWLALFLGRGILGSLWVHGTVTRSGGQRKTSALVKTINLKMPLEHYISLRSIKYYYSIYIFLKMINKYKHLLIVRDVNRF